MKYFRAHFRDGCLAALVSQHTNANSFHESVSTLVNENANFYDPGLV